MRTIDGTAAIAADQAWARGSTAAIVTPPVAPPAPPMPPTFYPPTAEGGRPGPGGPQRRRGRWIIIAAVLVAVGGGAGIGGWALRAVVTPTPAPTRPAASPTPAPATLTPEQAKTQTCGAYKVIGLHWTNAYKTWLAALPPNWSWSDPAVKNATEAFDAAATQDAAQLGALVAPNTPGDVTNAVRGAQAAIISLAASHGKTVGAETNAKIDETMAKIDEANRVCGLGQ